MKSIRPINFPIIEISIALMIILLPLSNNPDLMNGIQTAKSFNFFYSILALAGIGSIALLFRKNKLQLNITIIDILLLAYVAWVSINKYLVHDVYSFSLKYYELLGLSVLYLIIRLINKKYYLFFLVSICISGTIQAIYGCLQLWGYSPSHHGLFKMTGSFFNPGPYAGYLCIILPVALGLYWQNNPKEHKGRTEEYKEKKSKITAPSDSTVIARRYDEANSNRVETNFLRSFGATLSRLLGYAHNDGAFSKDAIKQKLIRTISAITIISILLVLPAARSRAAWLGAIAGCVFVAWYKFKLGQLFKQQSYQTIKFFKRIIKVRNCVLLAILAVFLLAGSFTLYRYKKDSADGRILIWTVTSNIIKDYPIVGVGQDMFKAHYMDYQADYFRNHTDSKYALVADDNKYAFNEFLNIWTENGAIGLLLFLSVLVFVFLPKTLKFVIGRNKDEAILDERDSFAPLGMTNHSNSEASNPSNVSASNFKHEVSNSATFKLSIVIRSALLSLVIFGCFAYPSEILPTKLVAISCLGILGSYLALNHSAFKQHPDVKWDQTLKRVALNISNKKYQTLLKLSISALTLFVTINIFTKTDQLQAAYKTWNNAMSLYYKGLYNESIQECSKCYNALKINGEFLFNYGTILNRCSEIKTASIILNESFMRYNSVQLCLELGSNLQNQKKSTKAERYYKDAVNMTPSKFYPEYMLFKYYKLESNSIKMSLTGKCILKKPIKYNSVAIQEIKKEVRQTLLD